MPVSVSSTAFDIWSVFCSLKTSFILLTNIVVENSFNTLACIILEQVCVATRSIVDFTQEVGAAFDLVRDETGLVGAFNLGRDEISLIGEDWWELISLLGTLGDDA